MPTKHYVFNIDGRSIKVEAEQEGNARYMVRAIPSDTGVPARIRIGYLTGAAKTWHAEFFGGRFANATSAKQACLALATWAIKQPSLLPQ